MPLAMPNVRTDALLAAKAILSHTDAPVINPPAAVQASGRCENANRLAGRAGSDYAACNHFFPASVGGRRSHQHVGEFAT